MADYSQVETLATYPYLASILSQWIEVFNEQAFKSEWGRYSIEVFTVNLASEFLGVALGTRVVEDE